MKTLLRIVFVCFIFCGMMFSALTMKNPVPMQLAAFGFLGLIAWRYEHKRKKEFERRFAQWQMREMRKD